MKLTKKYVESHLPILILGAGGHAKVLIDTLLLRGQTILGIVEADVSRVGQSVLGVQILGGDELVFMHSPDSIALVNGLGSVQSTLQRKKVFEKFKEAGFQFASVIHPSAIIANSVLFGEGVQVLAGTILQADCRIGENSIINTKASIDHDCMIGSHVHIAPGVVLSGGVTVEHGAHIGTGAIVIQGKHIGTNALVAAGSVVIDHVPMQKMVMGVPGRIVGNTEQFPSDSMTGEDNEP